MQKNIVKNIFELHDSIKVPRALTAKTAVFLIWYSQNTSFQISYFSGSIKQYP